MKAWQEVWDSHPSIPTFMVAKARQKFWPQALWPAASKEIENRWFRIAGVAGINNGLNSFSRVALPDKASGDY